MKKNHHHLIARLFSGKKIEIFSIGIVLFVTAIAIFSYSGGAAGRGQAVTGAPFNNSQTCAKCHSGGNFSGQIFTRLYKSDSTQITSYTPNKVYYFVIALFHTAASPIHGFQTTCAKTSDNTNLNGWTSLPINTANRVVNARNYVEHTTPLTKDTIIIPWKAPAAGTGSVTFYTASNLANGNGSTSGDQVVKSSLTITEGTAAPSVTENTGVENLSAAAKPSYSMKVYSLSGSNRILFYNGSNKQKVYITYTDINGNILYSNTTTVSPGNNVWPLYSFKSEKIVIVNALTEDKVKTSLKLGINQ